MDEIGIVEVGPAEIGVAKVGASKVAGFQPGTTEVGRDLGVFRAPIVPCPSASPKQIDVLNARHANPLSRNLHTYRPWD